MQGGPSGFQRPKVVRLHPSKFRFDVSVLRISSSIGTTDRQNAIPFAGALSLAELSCVARAQGLPCGLADVLPRQCAGLVHVGGPLHHCAHAARGVPQ